MNIHICKIFSGEMLIGELLRTAEDHYLFEFPFIINQSMEPTPTSFTEIVTLMPFMYKFAGTPVVEIKKSTMIIDPYPANISFIRLYQLSFIQQTKFDLEQANRIDKAYASFAAKESITAESFGVDQSELEERILH